MKAIPLLLAVAMVAGCGKDEAVPAAAAHVMQGQLALEIRDTATVSIDAVGSTTQVSLTVSKGFGVLPEGTRLTGPGTIEVFPETDGVLYTAKIAGPAVAGGPCGDAPESIGLSLHRDEDNDHVAGGLAVYCGASTWHGAPARMLRLAGDLSR